MQLTQPETNFLNGLADLLEIDAAELGESFELNEENFDSVIVVSTIALIDEHFSLTVRGRELLTTKSIGDLLELIRKTQAEA